MYQFKSRVRYSETGEQGCLTLTGIINYLQDTSTFQSEDIGAGMRYLGHNGKVWWLSSWQIIVDRYPELGEEIVVSTWPYDFKGIYGMRNFTMQDKDGRYLVRANSQWFYYDVEAGRPARPSEDLVNRYGRLEEKLDMEYAPRKIAVPREYEVGEPILVMKHHLDTNHHVNNAQYVEIAREVLPDDFCIGELRVEYKKAAVMGDYMIPHISRTEEGYVVVLCDSEGSAHAVIWLKEQG